MLAWNEKVITEIGTFRLRFLLINLLTTLFSDHFFYAVKVHRLTVEDDKLASEALLPPSQSDLGVVLAFHWKLVNKTRTPPKENDF